MISIIIPVLNEVENLRTLLPKLKHDVIVVDGGSTDGSSNVARKYARVVKSKPGSRAFQMNVGAKKAKYDILLFLHADSDLPKDWDQLIEQAIKICKWGGFHVKFDSEKLLYRFIEFRSNKIRVDVFKAFLGDQGVFVHKQVFNEAGGFPNVPILEDLIFSKTLRDKYPAAIITAPITTSARRFEEHGPLKTYFVMGLILFLYHLNVPLNKLKSLYKFLI